MKLKHLLLALILITPNLVFAKEVYFKNNNNVTLTKKEYDYIVERFSENYPNVMTQKDYDNLIKDEYLNGKIQIVTSNDSINPLATYYETGSKSIKITSTCVSDRCNITVVTQWLKQPTITSYDVIGARFADTSLINSPNTVAYTKTNTIYSTEAQKFSNGFGVSIKIPSGLYLEIDQYFEVKPSGTVFASYQHATSNISLANSKKYTISSSGFGGVFSFNNSVKNYYDGMGGVKISV